MAAEDEKQELRRTARVTRCAAHAAAGESDREFRLKCIHFLGEFATEFPLKNSMGRGAKSSMGRGVVESLALPPPKSHYAPSHRTFGATSHRILERSFCGEFP